MQLVSIEKHDLLFLIKNNNNNKAFIEYDLFIIHSNTFKFQITSKSSAAQNQAVARL